ncbi:fimbrial protein [Enterobacter sp.]|uniref:fimbrial protein n=1 Tax=Enterobacter sp. TaxID=42895 RepID=UPI0028AD4E26|nr:fimbrial protein [Enterobacter sp.]
MRKFVLFCFMLFSFFSTNNADAGMMGVPGVLGIPANTPGYIIDSAGCSIPLDITNWFQHSGSLKWCIFNQSVPWADDIYVPVESNTWALRVNVSSMPWANHYAATGRTARNVKYFRLDRSVGAQNPDWGGMTETSVPTSGGTALCYYLTDNVNTGEHYIGKNGPWCNGNFKPLPPNPAMNTCAINNDNPVTVDMGEINRAEISTAAGSGEVKYKSIPVWCYSDSGFSSMPVNLQFSYTPTTFVDGKAIQSSVPGVGISVGYDSRILVSNEVLNLNLPTGDSNMDFTFEAIRDSSVAVADIPTGPFTASGVLIMSLP